MPNYPGPVSLAQVWASVLALLKYCLLLSPLPGIFPFFQPAKAIFPRANKSRRQSPGRVKHKKPLPGEGFPLGK
jgi:hypothetical protein